MNNPPKARDCSRGQIARARKASHASSVRGVASLDFIDPGCDGADRRNTAAKPAESWSCHAAATALAHGDVMHAAPIAVAPALS